MESVSFKHRNWGGQRGHIRDRGRRAGSSYIDVPLISIIRKVDICVADLYGFGIYSFHTRSHKYTGI